MRPDAIANEMCSLSLNQMYVILMDSIEVGRIIVQTLALWNKMTIVIQYNSFHYLECLSNFARSIFFISIFNINQYDLVSNYRDAPILYR